MAPPFISGFILGAAGIALILVGLVSIASCNGADTLVYLGLGVLCLAAAAGTAGMIPVTFFAAPVGLIVLAAGLYFLSAGSCTLAFPNL